MGLLAIQVSQLQLLTSLTASLMSFKCKMLPYPTPPTGLAPRASQRDAERNKRPLAGWVGLARQRSE